MQIVMNGEGFWDINHSVVKQPGIKRILFLGDSFTIGYGISRADRFSDIIQKRLPRSYQVINMGMWGYSTDQELLVLRQKGLKYAPDILPLYKELGLRTIPIGTAKGTLSESNAAKLRALLEEAQK